MDKVLNDVKLRFRQISACTRLRDSVKFSFFSNMAERLANNGQKWMKIGKIHPCIYSKKFRGVVFEFFFWLKLKSPCSPITITSPRHIMTSSSLLLLWQLSLLIGTFLG